MAAQELPVTPPSATGTEKKVQIIERTAEDDGIGFVMVGTGTTDSAQDEAVKLFGESLLPDAVVLDNRPRDVEGNVIHDEADHEVEHEAATSREAHWHGGQCGKQASGANAARDAVIAQALRIKESRLQ